MKGCGAALLGSSLTFVSFFTDQSRWAHMKITVLVVNGDVVSSQLNTLVSSLTKHF